MNDILKVVLSLSFSGSLLITAIFFCRFLWKNVMSRQWQYYLWLIVIARLLLPFAPSKSLMGMIFGQMEQQAQTGPALDEKDYAAALGQSERYGMTAAGGESAVAGTTAADKTTKSAKENTTGRQSEESGTKKAGGQNSVAGINAAGGQNAAPGLNAKLQPDKSPGLNKESQDDEVFGLNIKPQEELNAETYRGENPNTEAITGENPNAESIADENPNTADLAGENPDAESIAGIKPSMAELTGENPDTADIAYTADLTNTAESKPDQNSMHNENALHDIFKALVSNLWMAWFSAALVLLIRRVTAYQSFVNFVKTGWRAVSDVRLLDDLAVIGERAGVKRPVELYESRLVSTPMLIGFFKPCIVLPDTDVPEVDFLYIIRHELTHYKRRDAFYKWLVQCVICIHWFNPLVWLMGRELSRDCELSCDEAVIQTLDLWERRQYGDTLLHSAGSNCKNAIASITLCESAQLLKERLKAIMNFRKKSKLVTMLSVLLTSVLMTGAVSAGAYTKPVTQQKSKDILLSRSNNNQELQIKSSNGQEKDLTQSKNNQDPQPEYGNEQAKTSNHLKNNKELLEESGSGTQKQSLKKKTVSSDFIRQCYEAGSIPLFKAAFPQLDKKEQQSWLDQCYSDDNIMFFGAAVDSMDADSSMFDSLAERAYKDGEIAFFSILANYMTDKELEAWLSRALKDGDFAFQSMIYNVMDDDDRDEKQEALKNKMEKQRLKRYKKFGITKRGGFYYYKGDLVKMLYEAPAKDDGAEIKIVHNFYMNPEGMVNVRITCGSNTEIKNVDYMSSAEEEKLLQQMGIEGEKNEKEKKAEKEEKKEKDKQGNAVDDGQVIEIPVEIDRIKSGGFIWLGTYRLEKGDRVSYDVSAGSGKCLAVGFARPGEQNPKTVYHTISNKRSDGKLEVKSDAFQWKDPAGTGKYSLFVHAEDGILKNIKGEIIIVRKGKS